MKIKVWVEIEGAPIDMVIDTFCRLRRQVAGENTEVMLKQGKYIMESSDPTETPEDVFKKYMSERDKNLKAKFGNGKDLERSEAEPSTLILRFR